MNDTTRRIRWCSPSPPPRCDMCERPADWQIGTDVPFKSRARFYCDRHAPSGTAEWFAAQERERRGEEDKAG